MELNEVLCEIAIYEICLKIVYLAFFVKFRKKIIVRIADIISEKAI